MTPQCCRLKNVALNVKETTKLNNHNHAGDFEATRLINFLSAFQKFSAKI